MENLSLVEEFEFGDTSFVSGLISDHAGMRRDFGFGPLGPPEPSL